MATNDITPDRMEKGPGARSIAAGIAAVIAMLLILANRAKVDVNFLVFKANDIQLWWFTLLVVFFTLVVERLIIAALKRRKNKG
jgi:hypothetical protein